jgi:hypothetical protein
MGELITVPIPRLTWLGHPEGTTLRSCEPAVYEQMQREWEAATGNLPPAARAPRFHHDSRSRTPDPRCSGG